MSVSILIVEDDLATCALWTRHLEYQGWQVNVVNDAEAARAAIAEQMPSAVILDVMLASETTGWDLLAELRASSDTQNLPIFIVSTIDEPRRARQAGATDCLVKPCSAHILVVRISEELEQQLT